MNPQTPATQSLDGPEAPDDLTPCQACGLPFADCATTVGQVLDRLEQHQDLATTPIALSFIGLGSAGKDILQKLYHTHASALPGASYLVVDSPDKPNASPPLAGPRFARYRISDAQMEGMTYCGLAEQAMTGDRRLDFHLHRSGIRRPDPRQCLVIAGGVGGGTASGALAHVLSGARALNPDGSTLALLVTPSANEADHLHFNAFYGISRLLRREPRPPIDMTLLVHYDRMRGARGIGPSGEELTQDTLIAYLLQLIGLEEGRPGIRQMVRLSRGADLRAFVPCLAIGRSLEIFGSISNVLESAVIFPLADIDMPHVLASYLLLRLPGQLLGEYSDARVAEDFYAWNKRHLPAVRTSMVTVVRSPEVHSDRVDACIMLGGNRLDHIIADTGQGFRRFRAYLEESEQWDTCGLARERVEQAQAIITAHDDRMGKFLHA